MHNTIKYRVFRLFVSLQKLVGNQIQQRHFNSKRALSSSEARFFNIRGRSYSKVLYYDCHYYLFEKFPLTLRP